jgi:hypothetical protein
VAPLEDLEKIGHDLDKLFAAAKKRGLSFSEQDTEQIVHRLNEAGKRAALRYDFEFHNVPLFTDISRVARAILQDTTIPLPPIGQPGRNHSHR